MKKILANDSLPPHPGGKAGIALLALRVFMGTAFLLHGASKVGDITGFAAAYDLPYFIAWMTVYSQLVGGALLVAGFLTKYVYPAVGGTMVGAVVVLIRRGEPFSSIEGHSWELAAFYVVAAHALAVFGAGAYSLDKIFFGDKTKSKLLTDKDEMQSESVEAKA